MPSANELCALGILACALLLILCVLQANEANWACAPEKEAREARTYGSGAQGQSPQNPVKKAQDPVEGLREENLHDLETLPQPQDEPQGQRARQGRSSREQPSIDVLTSGSRLPASAEFKDDPDAFVRAVYKKEEALGEKLSGDIGAQGDVPHERLALAAQEVEDAQVAAASPAAPQFEPLALDVLPEKYWQPVFQGCQSAFTEKRCNYTFPMPRLWSPSLNDLQFARSLEQGRVNMIEPLGARQALAQLLTLGVRTRRDVYTQATPANDIAAQSICAQLKSQSPSYVWL